MSLLGDDRPGGEGGLGVIYAIVIGLGGSAILSEMTWLAGATTSLLSGHGIPGSTAGRGPAFAPATIASGDPAASWTSKVTHGADLGPAWLFWIILLCLATAVGYLLVVLG